MDGISNADHIESQQTNPPQEGRVVSGFWWRILAFIIDGVLLGVVGTVIGYFLFDILARSGGWGRLIGFCLVLPYFCILNSAIGKGQTIGKRITKIEVVSQPGEHISVNRSLIRYVLLGLPFFLNGVIMPSSVATSPIGLAIALVVFGIGGAIIYLYLFNRRTRQSLHDLFVGTFVVKTSPKSHVRTPPVWKPHLIVVGIWFLIVLSALFILPRLMQKGVFPELLALQQSIESSGYVQAATVSVGKNWTSSEGAKMERTYLASMAFWKNQPDDLEAASKKIAAIILKDYPDIMTKDILSVTVSYGYDIGFASMGEHQTFQHTPQEWKNACEASNIPI